MYTSPVTVVRDVVSKLVNAAFRYTPKYPDTAVITGVLKLVKDGLDDTSRYEPTDASSGKLAVVNAVF
jgi:saccharopine dehydrogenase-like NADP-dependent oxidoreductase